MQRVHKAPLGLKDLLALRVLLVFKAHKVHRELLELRDRKVQQDPSDLLDSRGLKVRRDLRE